MQFSKEFMQKAEADFQQARAFFGNREAEIDAGLANCTGEQRVCMQFLYGSMPISDIANYPFELFLRFVDHALFVRENTPWGRSIPEDIFLNHVLYYRINNEDIEDCRRKFYDCVYPRLEAAGKTGSMSDAALELNYWCFENATYRLTDDRTANPLTVLRCAYGRCGEESTFAVTAFRSVGIPTRQIYTPRWAHCDDNHAWVEVWCDGDWHYLGACEPEPVLDKGWFTAAASRAMIIHGRSFSDYMKGEEIVTRDGLTTLCNVLPRYADTRRFCITVTENGKPVEGVALRLELLNYSEFFPISTLYTGKDGSASITLGLGDLHIHAVKDGKFVIVQADARETDHVELDFSQAASTQTECIEGIDFNVVPPKDNMRFAVRLTEEQKELQKKRFDESASLLHQKEGSYHTMESARKAAEACGLTGEPMELAAKALFDAKGNAAEIETFLNHAQDHEEKMLRARLLGSLTVKDQTDLTASIVETHMEAIKFRGSFEDSIFIPYLLSPRIDKERLCSWREELRASFSGTEQQQFIQNPETLWNWIQDNISEHPEKEYGSLITNPATILKVKTGSKLSKKVLFVAVCRTLGVPARINPENGAVQFYRDGTFQNVEKENKGFTVPLTVISGDETKWDYFANWSIGLLRDGVYQTLDFTDRKWENGRLMLDAAPGQYRLLTTKRMPNGSLFAKEYRFDVEEGKENQITIRLRDAKVSDMLENMEILDFQLQDEKGGKLAASKLTEGRKNILFWLEEGKEPTEHILNELIDLNQQFNALDAQLIFVIRAQAALANHTVAKALELLPKVQICYDDFRDNVSTIARRMYVDPDKLPLIVVTNPGLNGVYAFSGYNVGQGDLLLKILSE